MNPHEEDPLTRQIIGAAMEVMNVLGPGLDERIYHRSLVIELRQRGLFVDSEKRFAVQYKSESVGILIPDLVVEGTVIVECKVVPDFSPDHFAQILGYLAISRLRTGLLLNFYASRISWKRVIGRHIESP